jgi:hypothetical protein
MKKEEELIQEIAKTNNDKLQKAFLKYKEEQIENNIEIAEKLENMIKQCNKGVTNPDCNKLHIFKLIAEFLGWKKSDRIDGIFYQVSCNFVCLANIDSAYTEIDINDFEFDSNWNWLMFIVQKIISSNIGENLGYYATFRASDRLSSFTFNFNSFNLHTSEKLIDAAFNAVGEYLDFINTKK